MSALLHALIDAIVALLRPAVIVVTHSHSTPWASATFTARVTKSN
jgi:hypothetical protein